MGITHLTVAKRISSVFINSLSGGAERTGSPYFRAPKPLYTGLLYAVSVASLIATATLLAPSPARSAPPATSSPLPPASTNPDYLLAPGDTIAIEVFGKPELNRTVTIPTGGKVGYPFLGELQAVGVSVATFGETVRSGLAKELSNPQVTVTLVKRHIARVGILGTVARPGKFDLEEGWHVLDLLAESGGLSVTRPEWVQATLVRGATGSATPIDLVKLFSTGDLVENRLLEPGDVLVLREKDAVKTKIQVLGAVAKPGLVDAPPDGSIATVLTDVGGVIPRAKLTQAVIRRDGVNIPVDLTQLNTDGSAKSPDNPVPKLQPGDTLSIPTNILTYSVLGDVVAPGVREFPTENKMTAVTALLASGGASPSGDPKSASIIRMSTDGNPVVIPINLEAAVRGNNKVAGTNNIPLEPGDVLYMPSRKQGGGQGFGIRDVLSFIPFAGLFLR